MNKITLVLVKKEIINILTLVLQITSFLLYKRSDYTVYIYLLENYYFLQEHELLTYIIKKQFRLIFFFKSYSKTSKTDNTASCKLLVVFEVMLGKRHSDSD